jgi:hypothetical protein
MSSFIDYKLLRTKADLNPDADYAETQSSPAAAELIEIQSPTGKIEGSVEVEVVVEWLNAAGAVVAGRGSFTMNLVRVLDRAQPTLSGQIVVDSVSISGVGSRPILIGDCRVGDQLGVRLTNIVAPGGATGLRVLYKEGLENG